MSITFRYAAASDTGRVRSKNDDSAYTGRYLVVVADGMGGHVGGNVASAATVLDLTPLDHPGYHGSAGTYLADEIQTANIILNQLVELNPLLAGMGTTCTALLVDGDQIEVAHIGDSRAYRLRGEDFEQVTTDHTFVQRLVEEGRIRPEEAEHHPHKNVVMRVLGDTDASPELELLRVDAVPGDRWLLCSDGLSGVVPEEEIRAALAGGEDLDRICRTLIERTLDGGAPDNVTVAIAEVIPDPDSAQPTTSRLPAQDAPALPTATTRTLRSSPPVDADRRAPDSPAEDAATDTARPPAEQPVEHSGEQPSGDPAEREDPETAEETPDTDAQQADAQPGGPEQARPLRRVAPWRRRLPREHGAMVRHTLRHGAWQGDSFSDGVLNAMTQRSGMDLEDAGTQELSSASALRTELAERPHVLVGAASEATRTGAIPAVAEVTVQRRASLAQATAAAPGEELPEGLVEETPSRRRRRWVLPLFIAAFALVLVVGAAWAVLHWVSQQYYVGESEGHVAVYRGVDQSLGPIHLDDLEQRSDVLVADLPDYDQSRVRAGIAASSRAEADQIVGDLRQEASGAAKPSASPAPQGTVSTAPSSPSSSASPSRTDGERP
ncbi:PP2C family protein-serine/threonine phosphatase [Rothia kristinae]|uniref:PP2C family protein-serine/threonine phosphatase n=1 Tax=Rothia kristinae TaxID=37923 RepID=UPI0021A7D53E|nr:protein phosphatase 2C domain-containing protein [Rothia kristinae]MCT1357687.1 protein phosphatase 2C domain-containing protein [Rothia kristinae]MCT1393196.1 protein phosphatase 2C domain-containing protein [Rothia kristinae]MCT1506102.1 protein phosphatase 2C domain-containing protein [Rothia kristinae]MCT2037796.1 protein phosphatase 2C domain-containing protein [Rothia kristinae]MCT2243211.1 protein phosphatase 2C domain-containing protein [Rothia kristinae]